MTTAAFYIWNQNCTWGLVECQVLVAIAYSLSPQVSRTVSLAGTVIGTTTGLNISIVCVCPLYVVYGSRFTRSHTAGNLGQRRHGWGAGMLVLVASVAGVGRNCHDQAGEDERPVPG